MSSVFSKLKNKNHNLNADEAQSRNDMKLVKKQRTRGFLANLSKGIMTVVALMPLFGLLLGVGAAIKNVWPDSTAALEIGNLLGNTGGILFGNLGLFFAIAIALAFTNASGMAGISALVFYLVFSSVQNTFIHVDKDSGNVKDIFWIYTNPDFVKYSVGSNLGFQNVLQSGVLGGLTVGFITAFAYRRFKAQKLPLFLAFFSGERFVPIVVTLFGVILGFIFLLVYPLIGYVFYLMGNGLDKTPLGINALIFGFIERSLVPFGLHHVFYSPLWWLAPGGSVTLGDHLFIKQGNDWIDIGTIQNWLDTHPGLKKDLPLTGDSNLWQTFRAWGLPLDNHMFKVGSDLKSAKELNLGQYQQGKYPFMIFGLPMAGLAMIICALPEKRKEAIGIIGAAMLTVFLTGITEPLEFTFLFLAPWLFWGFHAVLCAISFMVMSLLNVHIGMTFSGGLFDYIIYGLLPYAGHQSIDVNGLTVKWSQSTNAYWVPVLGVIYAVIYFFSFWFFIKKFNIQTPGRTADNVTLYTRKDYNAKNDGTVSMNASHASHQETVSETENSINGNLMKYLGGKANITEIDNCASRLRIKVKDKSLVNLEALKSSTQAYGTRWDDDQLQIIYGPKVALIKAEFEDYYKNH